MIVVPHGMTIEFPCACLLDRQAFKSLLCLAGEKINEWKKGFIYE